MTKQEQRQLDLLLQGMTVEEMVEQEWQRKRARALESRRQLPAKIASVENSSCPNCGQSVCQE